MVHMLHSVMKWPQQCPVQKVLHVMMAEVEWLLSAEQKATDYRSPDDSIIPDHRPTNSCSRVVAYLSRVVESAFTALEGLNKQAFLTELGNRLHRGLLNHWQKFSSILAEHPFRFCQTSPCVRFLLPRLKLQDAGCKMLCNLIHIVWFLSKALH